MNDEARMTKSEGNPNDEVVFRKVVARRSSFRLRD